MNEMWKPVTISPFNSIYKISNFGRVKRITTNRIFKPSKKRRYLKALLRYKKQSKHANIHRLVALAFIPNPEKKLYVNHKDCNKHNNHVNNLEWVTPKENDSHACKYGLKAHGIRINKAILTENKVKEIRSIYKKGSKDFSLSALAKRFKVNSKNTIKQIVAYKTWKHVV